MSYKTFWKVWDATIWAGFFFGWVDGCFTFMLEEVVYSVSEATIRALGVGEVKVRQVMSSFPV